MLYLFFCGLCMGAADLVPGISGGTIAFIMGFYSQLLEGLKSFNAHSFRLLLKGEFPAFFQIIPWKFLLPLIGGIATSFIFLTGFLHFILEHDLYRIYLYATFTGLIFASSLFCLRQVNRWDFVTISSLLIGAIIAYLFTGSALEMSVVYVSSAYLDLWLVFCGVLAISAMLLPGISGSYLLTLLGVYPTIIKSLAHFISSVKQGHFDTNAFSILSSLFVGIVVGLLFFSRMVSWLLKQYPQPTLALLTGFVIGGIRCVWPFQSIPADLVSGTYLKMILVSISGFALVLILEYVASVSTYRIEELNK